ncbi:YxeA family protein [Caldalkalibacillus mannanilyticus]|uniref:YxeA family protein n=1 Tax=Caldalkalibacillus mannanilyticus TaxID=1418 RepID=UPI0004696DB7|nr:YxeA family protein [Caldalkalibacillus mannanilyticus]
MKKIIIASAVIVAIVFGALVFLQNVNINRLGADEYYTQVEGQGERLEDILSSGEIMVRYEYTLPAFNQAGQQKLLTFTAPKQLQEKAYLVLYVKNEKVVTSYQEVNEQEIPEKAAEKLP